MQHCCNTSRKGMLRVLTPTFKPVWQQTRLFQLAKGCCRKQRVVAFCNKTCTCCAFYRPKANLFCGKWRKPRVGQDSRVISSNQATVLTQIEAPWFVERQVWTWVVKRATPFSTCLQPFLLPVVPHLKGGKHSTVAERRKAMMEAKRSSARLARKFEAQTPEKVSHRLVCYLPYKLCLGTWIGVS